jgi:hypothetical protein
MFYEVKMIIPKNDSPDSDYVGLLGNSIPGGSSRDVYHVIGCNDCVIKVNAQCGANNNESNYYFDALNNRSDVLRCIGKILSISKSGKYLIMEYLPDIACPKAVTVDVPTDIDDLKRSSFGEVDGVIKLRDYARKKLGIPPGEIGKYTIQSINVGNELKNFGNELDSIFNSTDEDFQ